MPAQPILNPLDHYAVADGKYHPLSEVFGGLAGSLAHARVQFPFVQSLAESRDRVALQWCINHAIRKDSTRYGDTVYVPAGDYYLDAPLIVDVAMGLNFGGAGMGTRLMYFGPIDQPALKIVNCQQCNFHDFRLHGEDPASATGIWLTNRSGETYSIVSSGNRLKDVAITRFRTCVANVYDTGGDANNDLHWFEHCTFDQFQVAGLHVVGGQSHFLRLVDCAFQAAANEGMRGVWCEYGAYVHLEGCTLNNCENAVDLYQFFPGVCSTVRCNSENCRRWLVTSYGGGHGGLAPMEVSNCRIACNPRPGDYVLDFNHAGPFTLRGNMIYSLGPVQPLCGVRWGVGRVEHCNNVWSWNGPWTKGALTMLNNAVPTSLLDSGNFYTDLNDGGNKTFDRTTPLTPWVAEPA